MQTNLGFLDTEQAWPPKSEVDRLTRYRDNRALFQGKHELVFKDWNRLLRDDMQATLEFVMNWPKRLSTLWADLLLGESPRVKADDPESQTQQVIDRIIETNSLWLTAYQVALDVSRFGTGLFVVRFDGKRVRIEATKPDLWFPVVSPDNVKEITAHVLAWVIDDGQQTSVWDAVALHEGKKMQLRVAIHERGRVTNRLMQVVDGQIRHALPLPVGLKPVEQTGVDEFLVVPVSGLATTDSCDAEGMDDYSDLDSIVQELEVRYAQISRILDKHADPNMYGPDSALILDPSTGRYIFKGGGKFFPLTQGDPAPGYVVWDGQLDAAYKQIEGLMEQFYSLSETSAAAFGQLKAGLAESGSALRRLMMAPLAKVNRIRMRFDPAIRTLLEVAAALEVSQSVTGAMQLPSGELAIDWQDGLPRDEQEATSIEVQRFSNGLSSRRSSVHRLTGLDGKALDEELAEIESDEKAQQPEPPAVGAGAGGGAGGGQRLGPDGKPIQPDTKPIQPDPKD